jgi:hypothetical protein
VSRLAVAIGCTAVSNDLHESLTQVDAKLAAVSGAEQPFILLLDQDKNSGISLLNVLRRLMSLEAFQNRSLRVIIAASPAATDELRGSEFSNVIRDVPISPMSSADVAGYIEHRLRMAGWSGGPLFSANALKLIEERGFGNPSSVNEICSAFLQDLSEGRDGLSGNDSRSEQIILDEPIVPDDFRGGRPTPDDDSAAAAADAATAYDDAAENIAQRPQSRARQTAALVSIVLFVVIAIAGIWLRSPAKARPGGHAADKLTAPVARQLQHSSADSPADHESKGGLATTALDGRRKSIKVTDAGNPPSERVFWRIRVAKYASARVSTPPSTYTASRGEL